MLLEIQSLRSFFDCFQGNASLTEMGIDMGYGVISSWKDKDDGFIVHLIILTRHSPVSTKHGAARAAVVVTFHAQCMLSAGRAQDDLTQTEAFLGAGACASESQIGSVLVEECLSE